MSATSRAVELEPCTEENFPRFGELLYELALFEKLSPPNFSALQRLKQEFLSNSEVNGFLLSFHGEPIGYCVTLQSYSSFLAKPTLYLEDLYIKPEFRRKGLGRAVMKQLANNAIESGCERMEWMVLNWNSNAIDFYKSIGAKPLEEWIPFRLDEQGIETLRAGNVDE